jgi:prevent-host-death family protein
MAREITQRELRNDSGEIMRRVEAGEAFVVTRNGVPVGKLVPIRPHRFVRADVASAVFAGADPLDADRFRREVDLHLDQDPTPRG